MLELLVKYKIARIIPMQESFFHAATLPKNIKLSQELVTLNYEKLSPFSQPLIITYMDDKELYLWFVKTNIFDEIFIVPEAFLLFSLLKKEEDGIYLFDTEPKKVLIIKNKKLLSAFTTATMDDISLQILKNEYQLTKSFLYSKNESDQKLSLAIKKFPLTELNQFLKVSLTKENMKHFVIEKLTYPLISLLVIYSIVSYSQSYFLEEKVDTLTQEYQALKSKNVVVKQAIKKYNSDIQHYEEFEKKELQFHDPYKVIDDMYSVVLPKDKAIITSLEISNDTMRLLLETKEDTIKYLKRLNKIKYFKNVVIEGTHKQQNGTKKIIFFIEMKAL